jgi:UDP-glucose 4-epimerase
MRIFITGGAGYVGSHCLRALLDAGHGVVVYDNLSTGHREAVDPRAELVVGDLADGELLAATLRRGRFEAVMHFAAFAEVGESVREPLAYYRNNVANTVNLLEAMRQTGVGRLVFSSSCATYGVPERMPITEDTPQVPVNPYGRTKLAIEWALRDSASAWGLGATALRYFNAAGAAADGSIGEHHEPESHLIPRVLQVALGQQAEGCIFGADYPTPDGTCIRDYIHVEDLATVHRIAVETQPQATLRCYNVGTGRGASVREVIEAARTVTQHAIPTTIGPRREGDPPQLLADPTRIQQELNWRPRWTDIRSTIETAWRWHQSHPKGFTS